MPRRCGVRLISAHRRCTARPKMPSNRCFNRPPSEAVGVVTASARDPPNVTARGLIFSWPHDGSSVAMRREFISYLVRRFAAVDAQAHLIPRPTFPPSCPQGPMVIKSPYGLSAGAPTLPRMG